MAPDVDALLDAHDVVVVDYSASWCAPCKAYSPKFARLEREMRRARPDAKVAFVSVDVDLQQDEARAARAQSVPTTIAWRRKRTIFGRVKRVEALRFSGDRSWNELLRTFHDLLSS